MSSSNSQVNGNGAVATAMVILFIVAVMGANWVIDTMAHAFPLVK